MIKHFYCAYISLIFVCTGWFSVCSCENDFDTVQNLGRKKLAQEEALDITSYLSQNSIVKAKLTAPYMLRTQSDTPLVEFTKSLHVDFYDDTGKIESSLFARYGKYYENKGKVFLKDSVVVFNVKRDTLFCEELWWDQNKEIFYTDKAVHIRKPDEKIDGTGLEANQDFNKWTITNAKGPINVADSTLPSN